MRFAYGKLWRIYLPMNSLEVHRPSYTAMQYLLPFFAELAYVRAISGK